jgi:hypothetical protein
MKSSVPKVSTKVVQDHCAPLAPITTGVMFLSEQAQGQGDGQKG